MEERDRIGEEKEKEQSKNLGTSASIYIRVRRLFHICSHWRGDQGPSKSGDTNRVTTQLENCPLDFKDLSCANII